MHSPQPYFKMCEGTAPAEKLYDKCKDYSADMDSFNPSVFSSYKRTEDEENYPQEVKKDSNVCGDPVEHLSRPVVPKDVTVVKRKTDL